MYRMLIHTTSSVSEIVTQQLYGGFVPDIQQLFDPSFVLGEVMNCHWEYVGVVRLTGPIFRFFLYGIPLKSRGVSSPMWGGFLDCLSIGHEKFRPTVAGLPESCFVLRNTFGSKSRHRRSVGGKTKSLLYPLYSALINRDERHVRGLRYRVPPPALHFA